ncbi:MAG: hypothetical protein RO009_03195 [Pseudorhodoplanes sp.]|nr:hypothetical protein [Pseudorhodoplanes sp.]
MSDNEFGENGWSEEVEQPVRAPTIPSLFRVLNGHIASQTAVLQDLAKIRDGQRIAKRDGVSVALACAALEEKYPPLEIDGRFGTFVGQAREGAFDKFAALACDLVGQAIAVTHSALEGVRFLDAINEAIPPQWSNLPISELSREVNRYAFTKMRGRLPGWSERAR